MLLEFPPNPIAKAVMEGILPMPGDPYRHAIYAAAIDRVEQKQAEKQAIPPPQLRLAHHGGPSHASCCEHAAIRNSFDAQWSGRSPRGTAVVDQFILLPPDARMQRILALPLAQQRELTQGLPFEKRRCSLPGFLPRSVKPYSR